MQMNKFYFHKLCLAIALASTSIVTNAQTDVQLPATPLKFGAFAAQFNADGTFKLNGTGWPAMGGNWKIKGGEIEVVTANAPKNCEGAGRYRARVEGKRLSFEVVADDCVPRRMILHGSTWSPAEEAKVIAARNIMHKASARPPKAPEKSNAKANWPSFRGAQATGVSEKQNLPDKWDGRTGENILVAYADSRPRAFQPHRLGQSRICHERGQQRSKSYVSPRFVRRWRCFGRSFTTEVDALRD